MYISWWLSNKEHYKHFNIRKKISLFQPMQEIQTSTHTRVLFHELKLSENPRLVIDKERINNKKRKMRNCSSVYQFSNRTTIQVMLSELPFPKASSTSFLDAASASVISCTIFTASWIWKRDLQRFKSRNYVMGKNIFFLLICTNLILVR